jgi:hypothetical protein
MKRSASKIMMIRPVLFGFNEQTADSNSFQNPDDNLPETIQQQALKEFDLFVDKLRTAGIQVEVFEDTSEPHTPDSIFPNNWISFHDDLVVLYPMLAENRRKERRPDIIEHYTADASSILDLSKEEDNQIFLEGTGSIVFDYENRIAYANISPRTNKELLKKLCDRLKYNLVTFKAIDSKGADIYHTNVLMCIGKRFAVLCKECIPNKNELDKIIGSLTATNHGIIEISAKQMNSFAGNMYQLFNDKLESFIVMSEQAFSALSSDQIKVLEKHGTILHSPLYTIEKYGGGSARCMIADVRLKI